ncbi:hypothetical protein EDD29_7002 [Actinocorallia herbida]|uniref:Uncharacterized protein n=1 Tax=Actinocorallia herbida TaxID=58109 RepID=A0A3N1D707_9ACTN|nr:hypothetical protein EDD29_7002 [Actinocorallia herbida]
MTPAELPAPPPPPTPTRSPFSPEGRTSLPAPAQAVFVLGLAGRSTLAARVLAGRVRGPVGWSVLVALAVRGSVLGAASVRCMPVGWRTVAARFAVDASVRT